MPVRVVIASLLAIITAFAIASPAEDKEVVVRPPAVAGMFYPSDSAQLQSLVSSQLSAVEDLPEIDGQIMAVIVPHAGLVYSGPIAAHSYLALRGRNIHKVILCGPSHRYRFSGMSVYGPGVQWKTPLGAVMSDSGLCRQLISFDAGIREVPEAQSQEHCLEVQLPFLVNVLDSFTIVPVIMGSQDPQSVDLLARSLEKLPFDDQTVMIASTDWQHYRPASIGGPMDSLGMKCLDALNPDKLQEYLAQGKVEACGGGPVSAVMKAAMAKGADQVRILKYGDSGDAFGDKTQVVGYVAAVIYKSASAETGNRSNVKEFDMAEQKSGHGSDLSLTDSEKKELLTIARHSIDSYLKNGKIPDFTASEHLQAPGAAFVTLTKYGQLRGCIGHTVAGMPLYQAVASCAVSAAMRDPRFPPVTPNELDTLRIEISVLTPLQEVASLDEIRVGRDGLMIVKGHYSGLLLPQVATEYDWDRTQFLQQTCQKAGLPKEAYKFSGAAIYRFEALVFGEE